MKPITRDRYDTQDTPESSDERESHRAAALERAIDRADYERDERRDREIEEREGGQ